MKKKNDITHHSHEDLSMIRVRRGHTTCGREANRVAAITNVKSWTTCNDCREFLDLPKLKKERKKA